MFPISVHALREYHGLPAPQDIRVPTASKLAALCTGIHPRHYNLGLAYPSEAPVFWIKYGPSITWNEVPAQVMAYEELRRLSSPVKAPGIFYACDLELRGAQRERRKSYIVMQYIPGKTADEWLKNIEDLARADSIYSHIAFALSELHRIPVPPGSRPAAINGGKIRHSLFDDQDAPRHYQDVEQLEDHLNQFLTITKKKDRVEGPSREPLVYGYSDVWLENFIISESGDIAVIDFSDTSILPSSFSRFVLSGAQSKIKRDISGLVQVPTTDGVDNTLALRAAAGPMVMGPSSFASLGRKMLGGDVETQESFDQ
ncbi:hypothetical protein SAPIO_CDS4441 [Scedosporium apiospermum]|uniref:Aminoglycoside phosphotransferase domain-containing protein n=1 Tax=Pseudallescheria apiosperma TaxID=563466 RepID=A0A084G871_PSEDA|nr:uncharacterized protein SAPIO_CDS4441 [Scedosporium apiospermum]KEZ43533.1 hypothetical protein SAPIO_CDS4441 [Scedosporium apiospermum]